MKEKLDINALLNKVEYKDLVRRYIMLIVALFIYGVTYNMFFVNTGLILGGSGGIAILLKNYLSPSVTIACFSVLGLLLSIICLKVMFILWDYALCMQL